MRTSGIETYQPPSIDAPVLAEIVRRLAEAYRPERIYLFGSTARGDAVQRIAIRVRSGRAKRTPQLTPAPFPVRGRPHALADGSRW